jgi:hypothetical protein
MKKYVIWIISEYKKGSLNMSLKSILKQLQTLCVEQRGEQGWKLYIFLHRSHFEVQGSISLGWGNLQVRTKNSSVTILTTVGTVDIAYVPYTSFKLRAGYLNILNCVSTTRLPDQKSSITCFFIHFHFPQDHQIVIYYRFSPLFLSLFELVDQLPYCLVALWLTFNLVVLLPAPQKLTMSHPDPRFVL